MILTGTGLPEFFGRREAAKIEGEQQAAASEKAHGEEAALKFHVSDQLARLDAINAAVPEGVPKLKQYPPLNTLDGQQLRGYVDESGNATEDGKLFVNLVQSGFFTPAGELTKKGEAFAMSRSDSLSDLEAFKTRRQAGLDADPEQSFGDMLGGVAGVLGDLVKGAAKTATIPFRVLGGKPLAGELADHAIRGEAMARTPYQGLAQMGAGLEFAADKLGGLEGDEYWRELQNFEQSKQDIEDLTAARLVGFLGASEQSVKALEAINNASKIASDNPEQAAREGTALGLITDPSNVATMGVAGSAGKLPLLARMGVKAEQAAEAGLIARQAALRAAQAKRGLDAARTLGRAAQNEARTLEAAGRMAEHQAMMARAGEHFRQAETLATQLPELEASAAARGQWAQKVLQDAGVAPGFMAGVEQARALGRSMRAAPARIVGPALDSIADGLVKADSKLGPLLDKFGKLRTGAAWLGVATGNPLLAGPEVARKMLAAGPALRGVANFSKILGSELMEARGSVPFWQRVSQNSTATPLMRSVAGSMDNLTLGGKVFTPFRRVAQVPQALAVAAPMNVLFQGLAKGGDFGGQTLKEGLAQSLVFDGGAAMAGALMGGGKHDLLRKQAGDELNFRRKLSPEQSPLFNRMNKGERKLIASVAGGFPELQFRLVESGPSSFDRGTNTATINVKGDKLRPLIAHEVNHYLGVKGQIEDGVVAMLVGDEANGGFFRSKDGTLDPHFKAAMDSYNSRMEASGLKPLDARDFAIEYFTEAAVDSLMGTAESGKLAKLAGRSGFERAMGKVIEATIPKLPILRDLYFRLGGAIDKNGRMVDGNGLLSGGVRELPGAKKMIEAIISEQAGRKTGSNGVSQKASEPVKIDLADIAPDSAFSAFDTDQSGKVLVDEKGKPKPLPEAKDKARAEVGKEAVKVIELEKMAEESGANLPPLENDPITQEEAGSETTEQRGKRVKRSDKGGYTGTHLSPRQIQAIRKSGVLNDLQLAVLRMLNRSSRDMAGDSFNVVYHPAIETDAQGGKKYAARGAELREVVPFGIRINKKGGIYVELLSVTHLIQNVQKMAGTEKGKRLYGGDTQAIMRDVQGVLNQFREGKYSDGYLQSRFGEKWKEYRNFLNSTMNTLTNEQRAQNPDLEGFGNQENKVVESFRIDRISKTAKSKSGLSLPFSYQDVKLNHFPSGVPETPAPATTEP